MKNKCLFLIALLEILFLAGCQIKFTVNFETDGGTEVKSFYVQKGSTIPIPTTSKEGYSLEGWYTSLNCGQTLDERWSFITSTVTNDTTLYAKWTINSYPINYYMAEGKNFELSHDETILNVSLGGVHSSALTSSGRLFMWGFNYYGQLGNETTTNSSIPIDITSQFNLTSGETIVSNSLGGVHSSALTSSGRLFMWGFNNDGQLGTGTTNDSLKPIDIASLFNLHNGETIASVSLGDWQSSALTSSGRLFMWGNNGSGQLGNGTVNKSFKPFDITGQFNLSSGETIVRVSLGNNHSSALTSSGRLFMWGYNVCGELGNGTTGEINATPIDITNQFNLINGEKIVNVSLGGGEHSSALTSSGRLFMWGDNYYGQLGNGTTGDKNTTPIEITNQFNLQSGETIVSVSLANNHSSALTSSGRLFMWGLNIFGEIGNGTTGGKNYTPIDITKQFNLINGEKIVIVSLGGGHTSALTSSGRLFMWGDNVWGELGCGNIRMSLSPILIQPACFIKEYENSLFFGANITPYIPIREGYTFSGWFIDENMAIPYTFGTMPAKILNLYGYWIPDN